VFSFKNEQRIVIKNKMNAKRYIIKILNVIFRGLDKEEFPKKIILHERERERQKAMTCN